MRRNFRLSVASVLAGLAAQGTATWWVAWHDWFGRGDLFAYLYWNGLFAAYLFAIGITLRGRLILDRQAIRIPVWMLIGSVAGFSWTWIVTATLQGWILAFSFPVLYIWSFAGLLFGLLFGWTRSPEHPRTPPRPWIAVLVPVVALIAVPVLTAGTMLGSRVIWNRPQLEVFTVPYGFVGKAYLVIDSDTGRDASHVDGAIRYEFDESGVLVIGSAPRSGWTKYRFLYRTEEGGEIPITAEWRSSIEDSPQNRSDPTVGIYSVHRGARQTSTCRVDYLSFSIGTKLDIIDRRGVDKLEDYIKGRCADEGAVN